MTQPTRNHPFRFTGSGGEYFRIWIVNLALTLVTLGIYSAWAKVRRKRYFNTHTLVDGHHFDYLANPVDILKGRIIAAGLFAAYTLAEGTLPVVAGILAVLFFIAMPWIVVKALQFNARNTSHRGLRFQFDGDMKDAYKVFLGGGLLSIITLGLALPYVAYLKTRFVAGNHRFGGSGFHFQGRPGPFYRIYLIALLLMLLALAAAMAAVIGIMGVALNPYELMAGSKKAVIAALVLGILAFYASLPFAAGYLNARSADLMFNGSRLEGLTLAGQHGARRLVWLYVSNLLLILLTLGFYLPWAQVRTARYWLDNLSVNGPEGGLDAFVAAAGQNTAATGSEMADLFDVDLALG